MKKLLTVVLALILIGTVALTEGIDWVSLTDDEINAIIEAGQQELKNRSGDESVNNETYHYSDMDVTIVGFENGEVDNTKALIVSLDWVNKGEKPTSIGFTGFLLSAYQNGKEIEKIYDRDSGKYDDYMPGYGAVVTYAFENADDSEITFYMRDVFDYNSDDVVFTVDPSTLD